MAARNRLPPWHEELRLRDGRELLIRPVRPDDAGPLREGFALLRPDEVRNRFLEPLHELSAQRADRHNAPFIRPTRPCIPGRELHHVAPQHTRLTS